MAKAFLAMTFFADREQMLVFYAISDAAFGDHQLILFFVVIIELFAQAFDINVNHVRTHCERIPPNMLGDH